MDAGEMTAFENAINRPNGIILVTGPTGSGKTTTLYAAISGLNDGSRNILSVEDPVEYALDGIGQTQVNSQVGMSFAAGLRAILRQDPDVVMVGEIRDPETAEIAVQAALTGHLATVTSIVAQRLVRRLCLDCKEPYTPSPRELSDLGIGRNPNSPFYRPVGWLTCQPTPFVNAKHCCKAALHLWFRVKQAPKTCFVSAAAKREINYGGVRSL